jgi:hypothetical protein
MRRSILMLALPALLVALGCRRAEQKPTEEPEGTEERTSVKSFDCTWAAEKHPLKEIGHKLPDAAISFALSQEQRDEYRRLDNEDTLVIGDAHFVRGWAPFPIRGTEDHWGLGIWIKISPADFAEFESLSPEPYPPYRGTIANQSFYSAPTLGVAAEMRFRPSEIDIEIEMVESKPVDGQFVRHDLRPEIHFVDETHPLAQFQRDGLPLDVLRGWMSDMLHRADKEPKREPFEPELALHGWRIAAPSAFGKAVATLPASPVAGDAVKAYFEVLAADERGETTFVRAGWWIRLDDVSRPELWSGTLDNYTKFPATIRYRSRVWVRADQIVEHAPSTSAR